jgi:hypothetical protein
MEYCEITWKVKTWFASRRAYFWAKNLVTREEVLRSSKLFGYYHKPGGARPFLLLLRVLKMRWKRSYRGC